MYAYIILSDKDFLSTRDYTSCYDIISMSTVSLIPTLLSCNMSSQLHHTISVLALIPEITFSTISLS